MWITLWGLRLSMKKCWNCSIVFSDQIPRGIHTHRTQKHLDYYLNWDDLKALKCQTVNINDISPFFPFQLACCWLSVVTLVSLLSVCWIYICLVTFNDQEDVNWWVITNIRTTWPTLNLAQKPRILYFLSFSPLPLLVTFILLTLCCPLLFHYQARLHKTEAMGELVHGAHHHFCSDNQLLRSVAGENLILW